MNDNLLHSFKEIEKALFKFGDFCIKEYRENKDTMEEMKKYHEGFYTKDDIEQKGFEVEPDWKPLEIDNLPSDILTGDYEFEVFRESEWTENISSMITIIANLTARAFKYRYRLKQTKKTNEELANKYINDNYPPHTELTDIYNAHDPLDHVLKDVIKKAFIAGRKSKETE